MKLYLKFKNFSICAHHGEGEAEKSLQCLEISAENYKTAWQTLTSRYNNKNVLIKNHTRALYYMTPVTSDSSAQVRQLIDTVNDYILMPFKC